MTTDSPPTAHQQAALDAFAAFLAAPAEPVFLLRGYAGTGKTFLLARLIAAVRGRRETAVLLAPTGRAARVMSEKSGQPATTIHKGIYAFDKLRRVEEAAAEVERKSFKYFFDLRANAEPAGTVYFVDEASMVSDALSESEFFRLGSGHVLTDLVRYVAPNPQNRRKLVFIGDGAQLPPVGDAVSRALDVAELRQLLTLAAPVREVELTEVVRQLGDSQILRNATALREALHGGHFAQLNLHRAPDVADVSAGALLDRYLAAGGGPGGAPDGAIIVAYANRTAHGYNQQVRAHFFPGQAAVQPDDRLIVTQNNYLGDYPLFNGEFGQVLQVGEALTRNVSVVDNKERVTVPLTWRQARLRVQQPDGQPREVARVLLDSLLTSRNNTLTAVEQRALYVDAVMRWRQQTKLSETHPDFDPFLKQDPYFNALRVKYGYAITCHKAQGGTWHTAFVDFAGFSGRTNAPYFRWVYTAITRAARQLYLLNDGGFAAWDKLDLSAFDRPRPPLPNLPLPAEALSRLALPADEAREEALGLNNRPDGMRRLYRFVVGQLAEAGIEVAEVLLPAQNQEKYTLRRGAEMGVLQVWYKGDESFSKATGATTPLLQEAADLLQQPPPSVLRPLDLPANQPPGFVDFHDRFVEVAAEAGISPLALAHNGYGHTYHLRDETGAANLVIHHNVKGQVSSGFVERHTSPALVARVRALLIGIQASP